ncbi:MAG: WD40 repeat domain-containing protein, partial [Chloroflexota bacterium]
EEDYDHARQHTRIYTKALEWEENDFDVSLLLRGTEISRAEEFLRLADNEGKLPAPLPLHRTLIAESRRRHAKVQRRIIIGVSVSLGVAIILLGVSLFLAGVAARAANQEQLARIQAQQLSSDLSALVGDAASNIYHQGNVITGLTVALYASASNETSLPARRALSEIAYLPGVVEIFDGHTEDVWSVAFSPDGRYLASGSRDGVVLVWDLETDEQVYRFANHELWVWALQFHPDGETIISGARDDLLYRWNFRTGEIIQTYTAHAGDVTDVSINRDGTQMLTTGLDQTIYLWDVASGAALRSFEGHQAGILTVGWAPDEQTFVSGGRYGDAIESAQVIVWDVASGEMLLEIRDLENSIAGVAYSADGSQIFAGTLFNAIYKFNAETGAVDAFLTTGEISGTWNVDFGPDDRYAIMSAPGRRLELWDLQQEALFDELIGHQDTVWTVAFSPDGNRFASGSKDQTTMVWDVQFGNIEREFSGAQTEINDTEVLGQTLISAGVDGELIQWDFASGEIVQYYANLGSNYFHVDAINGGAQFITASTQSELNPSGLLLWDAADGEILQEYDGHNSLIADIAISPDERTFLSASWDGTIRLWDIESGALLRTFDERIARYFAVDFHPDGRLAATGDADNGLLLWDVETSSIIGDFGTHTGPAFASPVEEEAADALEPPPGTSDIRAPVISVKFSPDGTQLLSGSNNGDLILFDVETGNDILRLVGHTAAVWDITFADDGRTAFSGSGDRTVLAWDLESGDAFNLLWNVTEIKSVEFVNNGQILTAGQGGTLQINQILSFDELVLWTLENRSIREPDCGLRIRYRLRPSCNDDGIFPTRTPFMTTTPSATPESTAMPTATTGAQPTITPTAAPITPDSLTASPRN